MVFQQFCLFLKQDVLVLGNYYIHEIVKTEDYQLRIDLLDQEGNWAFAGYKKFFIGGPDTLYRLNVSYYYGNAGMNIHSMQYGRPKIKWRFQNLLTLRNQTMIPAKHFWPLSVLKSENGLMSFYIIFHRVGLCQI